MFRQSLAAVSFYLTGRQSFNRHGYVAARAKAGLQDRWRLLESANLEGRVYIVTGGSAGLGREIVAWLLRRGAERVYVLCRSAEQATRAHAELLQESGATESPSRLTMIPGTDCGRRADVEAALQQVAAKENKIDGLVCNAGMLSNEPNFTDGEGMEVTLACHLIFGAHHLTQLALPLLRNAEGSRVVFVSSGGMLNTKWPGWDKVLSRKADLAEHEQSYSGQLQYAYAKRGQVLLAEQLAQEVQRSRDSGQASSDPNAVLFLSCHPGWCDTPGVDKAYAESKSYLEPLRSAWEGAAGICWLLAEKSPYQGNSSEEGTSSLEPGAFYLDCEAQDKHLDGWLTSASFTKNSTEEVEAFMQQLEEMTK